MVSIYSIIATIDFAVGLIATFASMFTANWIGMLLGIAVMAHGVAWEQLEKDLNNLSQASE